jgi:hypothetical protein
MDRQNKQLGSPMSSALGPRPRALRRPRRRGSVLILVAAVLVLLVLIGTAYIQAARLDRLSTANINDNFIDQVLAATLSRVASELREDVVCNCNGSEHFLTNFANAKDELYDYPYTNPSARGEYDDMWLASTTPGQNYTKWPHITNISATGSFLSEGETPGNGNDVDVSCEAVPDAGTTNLATGSDLADADGDGLTDSRWAVAPIAEIRGRKYVMAVRIVDLASLLNVNVALSQLGSGGAYGTGSDVPRWWYPSELDMAGFMFGVQGAPGGSAETEMKTLLGYRMGNDAADYLAGVNLPTAWADRYNSWTNAGRMYGNPMDPYRLLGINDELELRYGNGLNRIDADATIDKLMEQFTRDSDATAQEGDYNNSPFNDAASWFTDEPRKQMTVLSKTTIAAPALTTPLITDSRYQETSLERQIDINRSSDATIVGAFKKILDIGRNQTTFVLPPSIQDNRYEDYRRKMYCNRLLANLRDYADGDNKLTLVDQQRQPRYGMEALPFISEVYVQHDYEVKSSIPATGEGPWTLNVAKTGSVGFVIEIRNPFKKRIKLSDIRLNVAGSPPTLLSDLAGYPAGGTIEQGEYIVVYGDTGTASPMTLVRETQQLTDGNNDPVASLGWAANPFSAGEKLIELQAAVESGGWLTYQKVTVKDVPDSPANVTYDDGGSNPPAWLYKQRATIGCGKGLGMLATGDINDSPGPKFKTDETEGGYINYPSGTNTAAAYAAGLDNLGEEVKSKGATPNIDDTKQQMVFLDEEGNDGDLRHLGDLAMIAVMGPASNLTVPQVWNLHGAVDDSTTAGKTAIENFMLDFGDTANLISTAADQPNFQVPHSIIMLQRFTTMSPYQDGQDNDGDGKTDGSDDDEGEIAIAGRINLNTVAGFEDVSDPQNPTVADEHILMRTLPIPDANARKLAIEAMLKYRDIPSGNAADVRPNQGGGNRQWRDEKGIAHIGELFYALKGVLTTSPYDGDTSTLGGTVVDMSPYALDGSSDLVEDDREEQAMIFSWLTQVATTRSDVFVAYIEVRGYISQGNDTTTYDPDNIMEKKRAIAVFDRSTVGTEGGRVKLLGMLTMD